MEIGFPVRPLPVGLSLLVCSLILVTGTAWAYTLRAFFKPASQQQIKTVTRLSLLIGSGWFLLLLPTIKMARLSGSFEIASLRFSTQFLRAVPLAVGYLTIATHATNFIFVVCTHLKLKQRAKVPGREYLSGPAFSGVLSAVLAACAMLVGFGSFCCWPNHQVQCCSNAKQIGFGVHNFHEQNGYIPDPVDKTGLVSWRVQLLPFLDSRELLLKYDTTKRWSHDDNLPVAQTTIGVYHCPANLYPKDSKHRLFTAFALLTGPGTAFEKQQTRFQDLIDGTSNTALMVEACGQEIVWTETRDVRVEDHPLGINLVGKHRRASPGIASSYHHDSTQVLMADGRVERLSENTSQKVLRAMISPNDDKHATKKN